MSYEKLHEISKATALFASIQTLLEWDQETNMPNDEASYRGQQVSAIANLVHKHKTAPKFVKALKSLINLETGAILDPSLPPPLQASLREYRRDYSKPANSPPRLSNSFLIRPRKGCMLGATQKHIIFFPISRPTSKRS